MNCFKFTLNFRGYRNARTPIQTVESLWSLGFMGIERLILVKRKRERESWEGEMEGSINSSIYITHQRALRLRLSANA